ncbi:MAG: tetratricopeptide repeat protein, partial [Candidatus Omnitrophica bacterium]|nr:tetratricopeptide repeat protein [Candidatus Omnitrophota bacterium]
MSKKFSVLVLIFSFPFLVLSPNISFASAGVAEYLCELGVTFYGLGQYDDALSEFNKALMVDPESPVAKQYITEIFKQNLKPAPPIPAAPKAITPESPAPQARSLSKDEVMAQAMEQARLESFQKDYISSYNPPGMQPSVQPQKKEKEGIKAGPFRISGETQVGFGVTPDDFIWKRADFSLNDRSKNWRLNSTAAYDHKFNTYDPAIYDSLILNVDTDNEEGFNFHTNVTVDPWSFTGKSSKVTVKDGTGDTADVQLYYWSNTGYTVNRTAYTSNGDTINVPELKVYNGVTKSAAITSDRYKEIYTIPALKIESQFQPLREIWLDYTNDQMKVRAFPMGYQDQAYTSDDPLNITNHGIWWKDSKWLRQYTAGTYNSTDTTPSYTTGRWDDSLSFASKDSTGKYLTALRGAAFSFKSDEGTSFDTTIATPKHLWQEYGEVDNIIAAARLKHYFADNFMVGGTFTSRTGFVSGTKQTIDSQNFVGGVDLGYELVEGLKAQGEVLISNSKYDMNNSAYKTDGRGNAYFFSLIGRYPQKSIMDLTYGYDDIRMDKNENFILKTKIYGAHMDKGFDSALSDFHNTRQDVFWGRHIHFRKVLDYYAAGMEKSGSNWDELKATRIGDGIDVARNTLGFRIETIWEDKLVNLFDVRNVHNTNGKFIENVTRDELAVKVTDKLTAKGLGIYQKMHKTVGGVDPFVYDGDTGDYYLNASVPDAEDPSIKTGSFGLNYDFFDWLSLNGVYERTNDYTIAYDNFPQSVLLNNTTLYGTYYKDGQLYRYILPFLYNQGIFPQAPYEFYNVAKLGFRITPSDKFEIYLDYGFNEFKAASLNS